MKCHFVVNGGVTLVLVPENALEEELVKSLAHQENDVVEGSSPTVILNHSMRSGLIIGKKSKEVKPEDEA